MAFDHSDLPSGSSQAVVDARPVPGGSIDHDLDLRGPSERLERRSHPAPKAGALDEHFRRFRRSHAPRLARVMRASQRSASNEAATLVGAPAQASRPTRRPAAAWLTARNWVRLRLATDILALGISVVVALSFGERGSTGERCLATAFALGVLATIHARPAPDDRLQASVLATFGNVLGWCSLAAMMTIAVDSIFNGCSSGVARIPTVGPIGRVARSDASSAAGRAPPRYAPPWSGDTDADRRRRQSSEHTSPTD